MAVLKTNATVVVKVCQKTTCFVFLQTFYPNFFIFLHRYICHIWDILQLWPQWLRLSQKRTYGRDKNFTTMHFLQLSTLRFDFQPNWIWSQMFDLSSDWRPIAATGKQINPWLVHSRFSTFQQQKITAAINFWKMSLIQLHISRLPFLPSLSPRYLQRCLEEGTRVARAAWGHRARPAPRTRRRGRGGGAPAGDLQRRRGWWGSDRSREPSDLQALPLCCTCPRQSS